MKHQIRCLTRNKVFTTLMREICTTCLTLTKNDPKSGLFIRLKNIFGYSSVKLRDEQFLWRSKYSYLTVRGIKDHGSQNQEPPIHDLIGQKQKKNDNSERYKKKISMKVDWGVKLSDEQVEREDNVEENFPKYVLKQKWGVNLLEPMRVDERRATNNNVIPRFDDAMQSNKKFTKNLQDTEIKVINESSPETIGLSNHISILPSTAEQEAALKSLRGQELKYQINENLNINNSEKFSTNKNLNNYYNMPNEINREDEIIAWQNVIFRTKEHIKKMADEKKVETPEINREEPEIKFSILPEPPRPKLDIAAVRTTELYSLIDSYMDPREPPTAKGIRIALHQVNGKKYINNLSKQNQSSQNIRKQTHSTN